MNTEYLSSLPDSFIHSITETASAKSILMHTHFLKGDFPENILFDLAIVGVNEDRFKPDYSGCAMAADEVRKEFYTLIKPRKEFKIIDLGNIQGGNTIKDTHFALKQVVNNCLKNKLVLLIIGGSQDLISAQYSAYQGHCQNMNVLIVDAKVDMHSHENEIETGYLPRIIAHEPDYLFNITQAMLNQKLMMHLKE